MEKNQATEKQIIYLNHLRVQAGYEPYSVQESSRLNRTEAAILIGRFKEELEVLERKKKED